MREKVIVLLINLSQFGSKFILFVHLVQTDLGRFPCGLARCHALSGEGAGTCRRGSGFRFCVWRLPGGLLRVAAVLAPGSCSVEWLTPSPDTVPAGTFSVACLCRAPRHRHLSPAAQRTHVLQVSEGRFTASHQHRALVTPAVRGPRLCPP